MRNSGNHRPPPSGRALVAILWIASGGLLAAWTPGTYPVPSKGFTVDTSDRDCVVSFWQAVYKASEGYQNRIGWTGNYLAPAPYTNAAGTVSAAFVADVERRVNFYRAMCGVPAAVEVNTASTVHLEESNLHKPPASTLKSVAAQQAAYMVARTLADLGSSAALSHTPVQANCVAWTAAAWNANFYGNITSGFFGPGAVNAYLSETVPGLSGWNSEVGHRRWILNPRSTNFATGDTPGLFDGIKVRPPTNVLYVVPKPSELAPAPPRRFVSFPSAGFFPAPINTSIWSLSYPGANFSAATVSMTAADGTPVSAIKAPVQSGFGLPTLVWQVSAATAAKSVAADTTYHVTVNGISGTGVPASHSYSVTLINPELTTSPQTLTGTAAPHFGTPANYWFSPSAAAEAIQVNTFQSESANWTEGAEDSHPNLFIDRRSHPQAYPLRQGALGGIDPVSGQKSYHLTFPVQYDVMANGVASQILEIDRDILPHTSPKLRFSYRRGFMGPGVQLVTEISSDGGTSWSPIGNPISGNPLNVNGHLISDAAPTIGVEVNLPVSQSPVRLRFRYSYVSGGFLWHAAYPNNVTGILLDDISLPGCNWLVLKKTNDVPAAAGHLVFTPASAGQTHLNPNQDYLLRMRTKLGGTWMPYGPIKALKTSPTSLDGFDAWAEYSYPTMAGGFAGDHSADGVANGIAYAFGKNPLVRNHLKDALEMDLGKNKLKLTRPLASAAAGIHYGAEWSDNLTSWSSAGVEITTNGGVLEAQAPLGGGRRFIRWKFTKQ